MKKSLLPVLLIFDLFAVQSSFNEGKELAESRKNGIEENIKSGANKKDIPQYQEGFSIDEGQLSKSFENLEESEYGKNLRDIHKSRKPYILDETEPFMVRSDNVHKNPEKEFEGSEEVIEGSDGYTIETCEECPDEEYFVKARMIKKRYVYLDKEPYIKASKYCEKSMGAHGTLSIETRIVKEFDEVFREDGLFDIKLDPSKPRWTENRDSIIHEYYLVNGVPIELRKTVYQEGRPGIAPKCYLADDLRKYVVDNKDLIKDLLSSEQDKNIWWGQIGNAHLYHREVKDTGEHYWEPDDAYKHYEELCDQGLCRYESFEDDPPSDKFWKGKRVKGSWGRTMTFACRSACKDTCAELKARGCSRQSDPECLEKKEDKCLRWRWKFKCRDKIGVEKHKFSKANPFCLGGDCIDSSYESDKDMVQSLGYLSILDAAAKDKEINGDEIKIFKGETLSCNKVGIGDAAKIKDCCGNFKGLGVSLGLTKCDEAAKQLSKMRADGKCVYVGTHCAEKINVGLKKFCIREKSVFCCFGSKFAKLLQEQGKPQLGQNFGTSESPSCVGLTADELSKIDFSKLDLSEITNDVMDKFKPPAGEHIATGGELEKIRQHVEENLKKSGGEGAHLRENMKHLTSSMKTER